jgi:CSLREA domain-containing protein
MHGRTILVVLILAFAFVGGSAHATAPIVVDSTADTPGDCSVAGQCTLRAAVDAANAAAGADVITVPAGTYVLTNGALHPTGALEIDGAGPGSTIIDGNANDRVINAVDGTGLTVSGVRITNGKSTGGSGIFSGPTNTLSISDSTLDHNSAPTGSGGALIADTTATLRNVTLTNNDAGAGAGIWAMGDLTVISSRITHNAATGFAADGGGIAFHGGTLLLLDSVVSNNTVDANTTSGSSLARGGGVWAGGSRTVIDSTTISGNTLTAEWSNTGTAGALEAGPSTTITNSTISGNSAPSTGGVEFDGRASVVNTTISDNVTTDASQPGGIRNHGSGTEFVDSTIADNLPTNLTTIGARIKLLGTILSIGATGTNCWGGGFTLNVVDEGGNVANDASCTFAASADPALAALQDNGGGVQTRLPANGSPALGAVTAGAFPTDARGFFRASPADAGAAERATSGVGITVGMPATLLSGDTVNAIVTLRNRSGSALTSASVTFDGTTRTIGTLADGKSDVEIFQFAAGTATSCVDSSTPFAFSAAWNGTTHGRSVPAKVTALCGGVSGKVTANALPVAGGKVDVCLTTLGTCTEVTTNASGNYEALVPNGDYTVKAYPTASSPSTATATTAGPLTVAAPAVATQDIGLTPVGPPPPNVTLTTPIPAAANGVPSVPRSAGAAVTLANPCAGSAPTGWTIASGGVVVASGTFTQVGSTTNYTANIPAHLPLPQGGIGFFAAACGSAPVPSPWPFRYYDPSGTVKDAGGNAVAGATVTLLRSDSAGGPFTAVVNGSDVMSPENRRNPDTTLADGSYAWDVTGGFYKVHADKNGCTADSAVLQVPPPATGIDLVLSCPAAPAPTTTTTPLSGGGGGGGGGGPSAPAPVVQVTPPAAVTPAKQAAPSVSGTAREQHAKNGWLVAAALNVDERTVVHVRLLDAHGRALTLAAGSVLNGVRSGRPHVELATTSAGGALAASLRTAAHARQLEIVAVNGDGISTRVLVPVR